METPEQPEVPTPEEPQEPTPEVEEPSEPADPEAAAPEGDEPAEGEEGKPKENEPPKPAGHKRATGFQRVVARLERQLAEKDALLAQTLARLPQQSQPGGETPRQDPQKQLGEQFNTLVQRGVQEALAAERQAAQARELAAEWEKQIPADEEEAYEVRGLISQAMNLRPGPIKEALLTSQVLPQIMRELSRNPLELARLAALPEARAAAELGRLEERLSSGAAPQNQNRPAARPPPPPSKVNGAPAPSTRRWDDLPLSEHKRLANSAKTKR